MSSGNKPFPGPLFILIRDDILRLGYLIQRVQSGE